MMRLDTFSSFPPIQKIYFYLRRTRIAYWPFYIVTAALLGASAFAVSSRYRPNQIDKNETRSSADSYGNSLTSYKLNSYPSARMGLAPEMAIMRNPFTMPTSTSLATIVPPPILEIKGFSGAGLGSSYVFMSVDNSQDSPYRIGQEVGNGYRLTLISPSSQLIRISNGISRFEYKFKGY